jgi:tetratricopeptide (TPR) repeat protein/DNA-binding SARP family transcriptional activator
MGCVPMHIAFGILGPTVVNLGGVLEENWSTPKVRALLATLLVHAGQTVAIDDLVRWAWGDDEALPRHPASTFHTYATRLRRALSQSDPTATLRTGNGAFRLDVEKSHIDYHKFSQLIRQARLDLREKRPESAVEMAEAALELWRGRPLESLTSEAAEAWRSRVIRDEWLPANTVLLGSLVEMGEYDQVLARLNTLSVDHPEDVNRAMLRISALHELSRGSEATTYYFEARRRLLAQGDELAADHLRDHHESLRNRQSHNIGIVGEQKVDGLRQLPRDIADFVGRDDLMLALDEAAATSTGEVSPGVVVVDGMPGVGKSSLVVHWAHKVRSRFDGDFFINLNGFSEDGIVEQTAVIDDLLAAWGRTPDWAATPRSKEMLLSRLMAGRRMLVIFDNARNTDQVKHLVSLLAGSLVLVTSRQRLTSLRIATGARRVHVKPMRPDEGVELLSARLGSTVQIERKAGDRLVELSGGLPLVITVIAEHVAASGTGDISAFAQEMDSRRLISEVGDDGDGSTMARTFFSWSYDSLAVPEQRLFALLGLHPGAEIGLDLAVACDARTPAETRRSLGILVGAHLIERPELLDRYRFHDLLREFATYSAELHEHAADRQGAERRMISYYLAAVTEAHRILYPGNLVPPPIPVEDGVIPPAFATEDHARSWFSLEHSNVTAAVYLAARNGYFAQGWRLADTLATFLDRHGRFEDSRATRQIAVDCAGAVGDREAEASTRVGLGMVLTILGEHEQARQHLDASLRYAEEAHNERGEAATLSHLGRLEMARGAVDAAAELFQRCLGLAQSTGDPEALCWSYLQLGKALRVLGERDQALLNLRQAEFQAQRIGEKSAHASSLVEIGAIYRERGDYETAMSYCRHALAVTEGLPDVAATAGVRTTMAEIECDLGDLATATENVKCAVRLSAHDFSETARAQHILGNVRRRGNDVIGAMEAWRRAVALYRHVGNTALAVSVQAKIDDVHGGLRGGRFADGQGEG